MKGVTRVTSVVGSARSELRRARRILGFASLTSGMLAMYRAHDRLASEPEKDALRERYVHRWSRALLELFGIHLTVVGAAHGKRSGGRLVVANHRSTIDIGILLREFGGHVVSRDDLAHWPLVGAAARSVGTVFVDRASTASGVNAIRAMTRLLEGGASVTVFPEGTTFDGDLVRPFHKGAFVAARAADVPVVPVGIAYASGTDAAFVAESFTEHLGRLAKTKITRVAVVVGEDMPPERNSDRAARGARDRVGELVLAARRVVGE